jgi:segregation and condensation protein A
MQAAHEDIPPPDDLPFGVPEGAHEADALLLNIDGYEGPIDVLLEMARNQKVDLREISILQLARQYLAFIDRAKDLRLDLAAEYLVMAAWLAYLKSRLLLPRAKDESGEPSGEAMAEALAFQLRRLESMREAAQKLMARSQLGVNIFARGAPEGLRVAYNATYKDTLYDLLKAYGDIRRRAESTVYELPVFNVMTMEEAVERMSRMLGHLPKSGPFSVWTTLQSFLPDNITDPLLQRSALASTFTAGLELAKQGKVELRQDGLFRPIYLRTANRPPIDTDVIPSEAEGSHEISPLRVADPNAPVEMTGKEEENDDTATN